MLQILVAGTIDREGLNLLEARDDIEYRVLEQPDSTTIENHISEADALILRLTPVGEKILSKAKRLKVISRYGVGYDNVDLEVLAHYGIPLTIVDDTLSVSVAEHTLSLMLSLSRQTILMDRLTRNNGYARRSECFYRELKDKTVLIAGFGRIGRQVAPRCACFGMNVVVYAKQAQRMNVEENGYQYTKDFLQALPDANYITLHIPATADQSPLLGHEEFQNIRKGTFLVNTARGSLIDEDALYTALTDGTLHGAGLDVFANEPPADDNPLFSLENVIFTPHNAAMSQESLKATSRACVQNALDALDGKLNYNNVVNKNVL